MSDWSYYMADPLWRATYRRSMQPMNGTVFPRWIQGSVGGTTPMALWSNEYGYNYMKFGTNVGINAYDGGVQKFSSLVSPNLQHQVKNCTLSTMNPGGCQMAASQQLFTLDPPGGTPHPFGLSYKTGRSPAEKWVERPTGYVP